MFYNGATIGVKLCQAPKEHEKKTNSGKCKLKLKQL